MKKAIIISSAVVLLLAGLIIFIGRTFYPDNIARTTADGGEKGLKTRIYQTGPDRAAEAVRETIPQLSTYGQSWRLLTETKDGEDRVIKAEVPVLVFTDDLEVRIKNGPDAEVIRLDVVSRSRVGKSDFGENARHVRKLLESLDQKLSRKD